MNTQKQLTQAVFDDAPSWVRFARIDSDGLAYWMASDSKYYHVADLLGMDGESKKIRCLGIKYDATNWQNSLIKRHELEQSIFLGRQGRADHSDHGARDRRRERRRRVGRWWRG